ncbi:MAG: hypothetical protein K8S20_11975 [Chloroflexi bacterium]|nr:hypothetical protein [Chloroflexota bacterium]
MRLLNSLRRTLVRFEPIRVFLALLIAVLIWLYPALNASEISRSSGEPLQEYGRITLVTAVDAKAPNCSNACKINVCTKWIALGEPGCPSKTNPWDIGCCLSWEIQCDPDCVDPTPTEPPTISGVLNCAQSNNSWCTGSLTLNLSASDPQGASVLISGILNGTPFACPNAATSCSIPITSEGAGTISYRVDSATGLFATGSTSYTLDLSTPQINASLLGTSGADNYYISTVTVSASASDAASGVQSFEYSLDNGGSWSSVSSPLDFNDGDYTLLFRATDQAGWGAQTSTQSFSVDTTTPLITISATSTPGNNGWRISPVQFNASASDAGSGLASLTCEVNSAATDCASITLADGIWQVHVTACDRAGLCSDETRNFNVDTTTPTLTLSFLGDLGQNNWYTSAVQVTANASDAGSGIDSLLQSLDNGASWSSVQGPISFTGEGLHSYQLIACDKAGLCTDTGPQQVQIDTIAPTLHLPSSWNLGEPAYYNAEDHGSGLAYASTRVEGRNYTDGLFGASITSELYWNGRDSKGRQVPPGEYDMVVKIFDQAGNEARGRTTVEVDLLSSLLVASLPDHPEGDPTPASSLPTPASSFGGQTGASSVPPQTDTSTSGNTTHSAPLTKDSASIKFGVDSATVPVSNQQTGNILWGAAAAALVGATLADWQKKREEEQRARAQAKQQERREKQVEYDRINRAYQAALDARKAAELATAKDHAAAIEAKLAREDAAEEARYLAAQKEREQAAFDHRMSEHDGDQAMVDAWKAQQEKQTAAAKVLAMPAKDDDPPKWWENLINKGKQSWNNFIDEWAAPSTSSSFLYGKPGWVDLLPPPIKTPVELLYSNTQSDYSEKYVSDSKIVNLTKNIVSYLSGVRTQFINDYTMGLYGWVMGWKPENGNEFYQDGREAGRIISKVVGQIEMAVGGALFASSFSLIPPTTGGAAACAAATGPGAILCFGVGGVALAVEGAAAVGGLIVGGHGGAVVWNNINNPLQIRGDGSNNIPKVGDSVPEKPGIEYTYGRTKKQNALDYEVRVTDRPYRNLEILIKDVDTPSGEVAFDWYKGDTLIDAKFADGNGYKLDLNASWQQGIKDKLLDEAARQLKALDATSQFTEIEWWVSDKDAARQLQKFLNANDFGAITVKWVP